MSNYIFGQGTPWTYDQLQQKRQIAQQLMTNMGAPKNVGEGLNAIGDALLARGIEKRAAKEEERMRGEAEALWSQVSGGGNVDAIVSALGNPMIANNPGQRMVLEQQMKRMFAPPPAPPKPIEVGGVLLDPVTFEPIFDSRQDDIPDSIQALDMRAQRAGLQPGTPEYNEFMLTGGKSGPLVDMSGMNVGGQEVDTRPMVGAPPAGFQRRWNEELQSWVDEPIPGGKEDTTDKDANRDRQGKLKLGTTLESLNLNIAEIEDGGLPVTGAVGDFRRTGIGRAITGSGAVDFENRTSQITTSAALSEVQNMRDNSPTGGAVGQLTDAEREAIGNSVTALNSSTSGAEYLRAAKAYRELALNLAYGEGMWELGEDGSVSVRGAPQAPQPDAQPGGRIRYDAEGNRIP